jgi:leucyl/phenylalanyl-tRNA--protein transferase
MFGSLKKRVFALTSAELPFVDENLVDIGGELNVSTLLKAYRSGSFPWTVHPVTWWSPDPRAIIEFDGFHASRSFKKFLKKNPFQITLDTAFQEVIRGCAEARPDRRTTWITSEFIGAYSDMFEQGHAHSLEVWAGSRLVGGVYGVSIGGYFAGESMFHREPNASKVALYQLLQHLRSRGYAFLDIQMPTHITLQLGATVIPRREFLQRMREAQGRPVSFKGQTFSPLSITAG